MANSLDEQAKHALRVSQIQDQVGRGEYRVDPQAVADAIVRRLLEHRRLIGSWRRDPPDQAECS